MEESSSIICPLQRHAHKNPDHLFIVSSGKIFTYGEADRLASAATQKIVNAGLRPGDRVGVVVFPTAEYIIFLLGLWRAGVVACLLSPQAPLAEIEQSLKDINAQFLFNDPSLSLEEDAAAAGSHLWKYAVDQDATIMFTSGSLARPKAVLHSYGNHYYSALGSNEHIAFASGDRWFLALPLFHVSGLSIIFRAMTSGAAIVTGEYKNLESEIKNLHVTHVSLVTTQLSRLLQNPQAARSLKLLKAILLGASAIPPELIDQSVEARLPLYISYGLTEMASQVATSVCLRTPQDRTKINILKYRQVMIKDDGEILVKGEVLFKGYVSGDLLMRPLDKDGWFPTGDLGEWDNDGHLRVIGRKDNMFVSGGENIHPEEIEYHLCRHPAVEQAVVVPVEDPEFGQRPAAFVQFRPDQQATAQEMTDHLTQYLPKFKIPVKFLSWKDDPAYTSIKLKRKYFQAIADGMKKR